MPWLLLGGVVVFLLAQASRSPVPTPAPAPAPPGAPPAPPVPRSRFHFREISPIPETLELEPGTTYLAQAEIPFLLGAFVGLREITDALEREGFVVIRATQDRPDFWPSDGPADWYLVASYSGDRRPRAVPGGITRLWEAIAPPAGA